MHHVLQQRTACIGILLLLALAPACGSTGPGKREASPASRVVAGWITEIEDDNLSLRAVDGRQLVFSNSNPVVSSAYLQEHMVNVWPLRITYRAEAGRLVPLRIEGACPRRDPVCIPVK